MIGVGLSAGLGGAAQGGGAPASPNPNLLLWSEALDNAAWTKAGAMVNANTALDPGGVESTADEIVFAASGSVRQVTTTPALAGDPVFVSASPTAEWGRFSISGTFDEAVYVFSVYIRDPSASASVTLRIDRSGGFLRCSLIEGLAEGFSVLVAWAKLETPDLTTYVKREGT